MCWFRNKVQKGSRPDPMSCVSRTNSNKVMNVLWSGEAESGSKVMNQRYVVGVTETSRRAARPGGSLRRRLGRLFVPFFNVLSFRARRGRERLRGNWSLQRIQGMEFRNRACARGLI